MANRSDQFTDALVNFTHLIIPRALDVTGLSGHAPAHAPTLAGVLTPFLCLVILNCLSFMLMAFIGKLLLRLIEFSLSVLNFGLAKLFDSLPRKVKVLIGRVVPRSSSSKKTERKSFTGKRAKTTFNTNTDSWERVTNDNDFERATGEEYTEVIEALETLGLKASATQKEIRSAYIALMKQYHPDLYTNASHEQQKKIRAAALEIRHAYDTIVKQFNQVQ